MTTELKAKKEKETKLDKRIRKQVPFFAWLAILLVVFFVFYYLFNGINKIEYQGLHFSVEKIGSLLVYTYNYNILTANGSLAGRTQYFRIDPRKNDVPVDGNIFYPSGKTVYISVNDTGITGCDNSSIGILGLSMFLTNNNMAVRGATPDKAIAAGKNLTYATCSNHPLNAVILIEAGNETRIFSNGAYCYTIEVSDCKILQAAEKFMVQSVIDSKKP